MGYKEHNRGKKKKGTGAAKLTEGSRKSAGWQAEEEATRGVANKVRSKRWNDSCSENRMKKKVIQASRWIKKRSSGTKGGREDDLEIEHARKRKSKESQQGGKVTKAVKEKRLIIQGREAIIEKESGKEVVGCSLKEIGKQRAVYRGGGG